MVDPAIHDRLPPAEPGERMQRVRVGVTGLAAVILVMALATAIATGVRRSAEATNIATSAPVVMTPPTAANTSEPATEPLAQLGAAPGSNPEPKSPTAQKK